ncbi:MAG TPA: hypothetical protein P5195_01250 [Anaerolineae bacterium]|nr:hypothetical protein [Anaerolineae bacterium]
MSDSTCAPLIEAKGLCCNGLYGDAFEDIDLCLAPGTAAALVANPKSAGFLLMHCLMGFLPHSRGELRVLGMDPRQWGRDERRRVSLVRGAPRFPFAMRVEELLSQVAMLMGDKGGCERVLEDFGLKEVRGKYLHFLNAELQQLVRVACSVLGSPDVMMYESLFQHLSPARAKTVRQVLAGERDKGKLILFVADELVSVAAFCDVAVVMSGGRVRAADKPEKMMKDNSGWLTVEIETEGDFCGAHVEKLPFVRGVEAREGRFCLMLDDSPGSIYALMDALRARGVDLRWLRVNRPSLQDIVERMLMGEQKTEIGGRQADSGT